MGACGGIGRGQVARRTARTRTKLLRRSEPNLNFTQPPQITNPTSRPIRRKTSRSLARYRSPRRKLPEASACGLNRRAGDKRYIRELSILCFLSLRCIHSQSEGSQIIMVHFGEKLAHMRVGGIRCKSYHRATPRCLGIVHLGLTCSCIDNSPWTQVVIVGFVCFCSVGMFSAVSGLGAG